MDLSKGYLDFQVNKLVLQLAKASQTVTQLKLNGDTSFDYTPDELLLKRAKNSFYHLGDINIALKRKDNTWVKYSSAENRKDVIPLETEAGQLSKADITSTLNEIPLKVVRIWERLDEDLVLRFHIENNTTDDIEIGGLGIPMIFNNNMDWKSLDVAHHDNLFFDPYIGLDAGYLQVNRLHGLGESLLVLPLVNTPFEAYNPLNTDPTPKSITFEGFHEWVIHSKAYAQTDWAGVEQWNKPTATTLKKGESKDFALRFVLSPNIKQVENKLIEKKRPVAVGAPGYLIAMDAPAKLFIKHVQRIKDIEIYPANSLSLKKLKNTKNGWTQYIVEGNTWGRSRVTVTYADGSKQSINYKVIKSEKDVVNDLGNFLTTQQWYENPTDLFGRSPSVISYDYEEKRLITQESRAWYAGLSDEAGAASWLAAMMKQILQPNPQEISKLKRFADETMFNRIQHRSGDKQYGVVKSLFYYEPDSFPKGTYSDSINYKTWSAWPKKEADNIGRSYNYPHVTAAHWVLYRLARNYNNLIPEDQWKTHLERAYRTVVAMVEFAPHYAQFGQMEGSIFLITLSDLRREGLDDWANHLEKLMRDRAMHWKTLNYPFGSEMPWDSTGQEEVYLWSRYFGFDDKAQVTLNAILAYAPNIPHWGYHGSARRYWDFVYGGKLSRIERQLHHYGSALNAIPVLTEYRSNPDDFYLLRVGHAGMMGALANVTEDGFGPAAFHSYPSTLANDGISGDYGSGFYGYAVNSGTYVIDHPEFGWLAFSGNLVENKNNIHVEIKTASKARIFFASEEAWINLDAGEVNKFIFDKKSKSITLELGGTEFINNFLLNINEESGYIIPDSEKDSLGRYIIPKTSTSIVLKKKG
ncbi:hypothetical protein FAZ19_18230 [Sphingobacterium alkalisoli]|uniref:Uncharacterized protein n=1 Tax=Sphingobacterium alkalisoli TaxID=1874115 RepID=A0A4U0GWX0_9SPHI|nr:hypothetical protein FAZ19_18230 [Sphingobacterium alkalisoli]